MNKIRFTKMLCVILAIVFSLSILMSGCGTEKAVESTAEVATSKANTVEDTTETQKLDFVELSWYMLSPINPEKDYDVVMEEVNKQLKEKLNAKLTFYFFDFASYNDKMKIMAAAGDSYDLTFSTGWVNPLSTNVAQGSVIPLDDLLQKYGQDILGKVDAKYWPGVTYKKQRFAVLNPSVFARTASFVFKKDLVEKYNFDYKSVHELKDLESYLETIKKNEKGITPLLVTGVSAPGFWGDDKYDVLGDYAEFEIATGKVLPVMQNQVTLDKYKLLADFYKKGYIAKDAAIKKDSLAEAKTGKYAVMQDPGQFDETGEKSSTTFGFPCVESQYGNGTPITTEIITGGATAISKTSKNPERAMMLINLMFADKKFYNTCAYGIEGLNYKVISGQDTDNPTIEATSPSTWAIWHPWIGSLWDQWPSNWNSEKALKQMKADTDKAVISPLAGFTFDTTNVKTELSQVTAIVTETEAILFTGTAPDVEKYIKDTQDRLAKAGLVTVITELEAQIAAWKAENGK